MATAAIAGLSAAAAGYSANLSNDADLANLLQFGANAGRVAHLGTEYDEYGTAHGISSEQYLAALATPEAIAASLTTLVYSLASSSDGNSQQNAPKEAYDLLAGLAGLSRFLADPLGNAGGLLGSIASGISGFFERLGNLLSGDGWASDYEIRQAAVEAVAEDVAAAAHRGDSKQMADLLRNAGLNESEQNMLLNALDPRRQSLHEAAMEVRAAANRNGQLGAQSAESAASGGELYAAIYDTLKDLTGGNRPVTMADKVEAARQLGIPLEAVLSPDAGARGATLAAYDAQLMADRAVAQKYGVDVYALRTQAAQAGVSLHEMAQRIAAGGGRAVAGGSGQNFWQGLWNSVSGGAKRLFAAPGNPDPSHRRWFHDYSGETAFVAPAQFTIFFGGQAEYVVERGVSVQGAAALHVDMLALANGRPQDSLNLMLGLSKFDRKGMHVGFGAFAAIDFTGNVSKAAEWEGRRTKTYDFDAGPVGGGLAMVENHFGSTYFDAADFKSEPIFSMGIAGWGIGASSADTDHEFTEAEAALAMIPLTEGDDAHATIPGFGYSTFRNLGLWLSGQMKMETFARDIPLNPRDIWFR